MSVLRSIFAAGLSSAALVPTSGCEPLPYKDVALDKAKLITRVPQDNPTSMEALILGRLWIVDGCVKIGESAQQSRTTIWRDGYRVGEDASGMFVYHPAESDRHRIGGKVQFGGGYVESLSPDWIAEWLANGSVNGCPAPFLFVDTTGDE